MQVTSSFKSGLAGAALFALLLGLDVVMRLVPHSPNFTPIAASAIFAAFLFGRKIGAVLPVAALAATDLVIGGYDWRIMSVVYLSLAAPALFGGWMRNRLSPAPVLLSSVAASATFFLTTNFAVWFFGDWYGRTAQGLVQCYVSALPFFRNSAAGDLFWSVTLFGGYAVVARFRSHNRARSAGLAVATGN